MRLRKNKMQPRQFHIFRSCSEKRQVSYSSPEFVVLNKSQHGIVLPENTGLLPATNSGGL